MNRKNDLINVLCMALVVLLGFVLLHTLCGTSIIGHSYWDSYELQAKAWLSGRTYLDKNYTHLELAEFEGHYYVSFPPFPSVVLLPFVLIFGSAFPNNLFILLVCIITAALCYMLLREHGTEPVFAMLIAVFYVFGSNMTSMAMNGGVWFIAQSINMLLCTLALGFLLRNKKLWCYTMLALAVGCRPFSAVYLAGAFVYFAIKDKPEKISGKYIKDMLMPLIPTICIAGLYMLYNYIRFRNPLEFGHNYLPEFQADKQFALSYLLPNLKALFLEPIKFDNKLNISHTMFNGFWFYIANPMFLAAAYTAVRNCIENKAVSKKRLALLCVAAINLVLICCHRTLGGWQFGARYTCDLLPCVLGCMMITLSRDDENTVKDMIAPIKTDRVVTTLAAFAVLFNIYGAIILWKK